MTSSDKRLTPEFGPIFWCERESEREWHYCPACYRDVPTFRFSEGVVGSGSIGVARLVTSEGVVASGSVVVTGRAAREGVEISCSIVGAGRSTGEGVVPPGSVVVASRGAGEGIVLRLVVGACTPPDKQIIVSRRANTQDHGPADLVIQARVRSSGDVERCYRVRV